MFSTPGGPQQQQLIQLLARSRGGYPESGNNNYGFTPFNNFHIPQDPSAGPGVGDGNVGAVAAGQTYNPGGRMQPYNGPGADAGNGGLRDILQRLLGQGPQEITNVSPPNGFDNHHAMVRAASNLAQLLAQQHTAGLRRFQYNGRH